MRLRAIVLLAALALPAAAQQGAGQRPGGRTGIDVVVPVDPYEHDRLHWFDGQPHHLVPGTVTIDAPPYVCDRDGETFTDQEAFAAHLRSAHRVPAGQIPSRLVVEGGQVHFPR
ncbi:MAG TPA: hypothetical protein VKW76_14205 [Candidatus Binatia bacterium]|nr:hypothetical protein [Candidatus Binatia bacterium]